MELIIALATVWTALPQGEPQPQPTAVLLEAEGEVYIKTAPRESLAAQAGDQLHNGQQLLLAEDAEALLLYVNGQYSKLRGPAKADIGPPSRNLPSNQDTIGRHLAAAFPATVPRFSTTVGGVRDASDLVVLSPLAEGFTPRQFRLVVQRSPLVGRDVSPLLLANEVRFEVREVGSTGGLYEYTVEPEQAVTLLTTVDLAPPSITARNQQQPELILELQLLQNDPQGDQRQPLATQVSTFRIAPIDAQEALEGDLAELAEMVNRNRNDLSENTQALLRIGCYLEHGFLGEALAEVTQRQRAEPANPLWQQMIANLAAEHAAYDRAPPPTY